MKVNIKKKYVLIIILVLAVGVLITSFAYFNATVFGSPADDSGISTGTFELSLSDSTVSISGLAPIYDEDYETQAFKKTFTVTSSSGGTLNVCSSIYLNITSISETLKSQYFKYKIVTPDGDEHEGSFLNANITDDFLTIGSIFFETGETKTLIYTYG